MTRAATRALFAWPVLVVVFMLAGGLGAGVTAGLMQAIFDKPNEPVFYAVTFGACGYIAVQLALDVWRREAAAASTSKR